MHFIACPSVSMHSSIHEWQRHMHGKMCVCVCLCVCVCSWVCLMCNVQCECLRCFPRPGKTKRLADAMPSDCVGAAPSVPQPASVPKPSARQTNMTIPAAAARAEPYATPVPQGSLGRSWGVQERGDGMANPYASTAPQPKVPFQASPDGSKPPPEPTGPPPNRRVRAPPAPPPKPTVLPKPWWPSPPPPPVTKDVVEQGQPTQTENVTPSPMVAASAKYHPKAHAMHACTHSCTEHACLLMFMVVFICYVIPQICALWQQVANTAAPGKSESVSHSAWG